MVCALHRHIGLPPLVLLVMPFCEITHFLLFPVRCLFVFVCKIFLSHSLFLSSSHPTYKSRAIRKNCSFHGHNHSFMRSDLTMVHLNDHLSYFYFHLIKNHHGRWFGSLINCDNGKAHTQWYIYIMICSIFIHKIDQPRFIQNDSVRFVLVANMM